MSAKWKTVRVFISSTFRDMHAERDHLIKVTFPALREKLLPFRVELYDIDLRWGITENEAENEKVIGLCLQQVDECRPFFLALLGHRYGWVPAHVPEETQASFPFVTKYPGVSVTELEIRYGLLRFSTGTHALLLLRDEQSVESIPSATRQKDFIENDPALQEKLANLKRKLIEARDDLKLQLPLGSDAFSIHRYAPEWDPNPYDRINQREGKLTALDEFGRQVDEWLWLAIKNELQLTDTPAKVDPLDAESDLHERFLEMRTRIYIGRDELYRRLREFAMARGDIPLLLTGESGLGKSAALARFVRDFRTEQPDVCVLPHFVGASPRTTSLTGMLKRLTEELQRKFQLALPQAESSEEIIRTFIVAITSVPESSCVVLVLDALDQLDADSMGESLVWLPATLPDNVRVLFSSATGRQTVPSVVSSFGERQFANVVLEPLSHEERRDIIRAVPKLVAKTLDDKQIETLLAIPATENPLFLMVALEELRGYGSFENLNKLIQKLPHEGDALTKLFERVFERLEKEFDRHLVEEVLSLLACARRGLSEPELKELTRHHGPTADELYPLLRQLGPHLYLRDGRCDFYHTSIRRAVESRYLEWEDLEDQGDPWLRWNPDRRPPASDPTEPEREIRGQLIKFFMKDRLDDRSVDELPWQLAQLRSWQRLFDLLGDLEFFAAAWQANEFEVRAAWSLVKAVGGLEPIEAYRTVVANPTSYDHAVLWAPACWLRESGHGAEALTIWSFLIDNFRQTGDEARLHRCLNNQALILMDTGDLKGAMRLLEEKEAICRRLNDAYSLSACLGNQAVILKETGDRGGAMRLLKEQEEICRQLNDPAGLGACLGNQGLILRDTGDLDGAMQLLKEREAICLRLNDPVGLAGTRENQALILATTGNLTEAIRLHKEGEALFRRLNDPAGLATCLGNQGKIHWATEDHDEAMRLHMEEETIFRRLNNPAGLQHSLGAQAAILQDTGDLDGAMRLLKEKEAICRQLNDPTSLQTSLGEQALILKTTGDLDAAVRLLQEQESICRQLDHPDGLQASLGNQGLILWAAGDLDGASRLFMEQESICRRLNNLASLSAGLGNQALILYATGDLDGALRLHKEEEALCRQLNDPAGLSFCLGNQAVILVDIGNLDGAMRLYKEQEAICRRLNNPAGLQQSLGNQALLLQSAGDLEGAMRLLKEQEAICRRGNIAVGLRHSLGNQATILRDAGDLDGAMRLREEEEEICRRLNDRAALQTNLGAQALILQSAGDLDGALRLFKEQESICRQLNNAAELARCLSNQAQILMTQAPDLALPLFEEQEAICRARNDQAGLSACLGNQALILKAAGELERALELFEEQEAICRQNNNDPELVGCLWNQAVTFWGGGDLNGALHSFKQHEAICRRLDDAAGLSRSLGNQGIILKNAGDPRGALRLHQEEESICRQLNDQAGLSVCLGNQAVILMATNDLDEAMHLLKEQEKICRRLNVHESLAISLLNQGSLLAGLQSPPQYAQGWLLLQQALKIANENGLSALAQHIEPLMKEIVAREAMALTRSPE